MSAEMLREAASLMRERAQAATSGPWEVGDYWHIQGATHCRCKAGPLAWSGKRDINGTRMAAHVHRRAEAIGTDIMQADASSGDPANVSYRNDFGPGVEPHDSVHIASWHPLVALAVADWLDAAYADWYRSEHSLGAMSVRAMSGESNHPEQAALTLARAYLGRDA